MSKSLKVVFRSNPASGYLKTHEAPQRTYCSANESLDFSHSLNTTKSVYLRDYLLHIRTIGVTAYATTLEVFGLINYVTYPFMNKKHLPAWSILCDLDIKEEGTIFILTFTVNPNKDKEDVPDQTTPKS